jgi:hypothetical protein
MNTFFIIPFFLWGLLSGVPTQASAQGSSQGSSASESGASSSFVGKRDDVVIIILSVVLGVVVILTGTLPQAMVLAGVCFLVPNQAN